MANKNKKQVLVYYWGRKYLSDAGEFTDSLYELYLQFVDYDKSEFKNLKKSVENNKTMSKADYLDFIFRCYCEISFEFAEKLNLYDIVLSGCYKPINKLGKEI